MARRDEHLTDLERLAREARADVSRRGFLLGAAGIGAGGLLAACGTSSPSGTKSPNFTAAAGGVSALPGGTPVRGGTFTLGVLTQGSEENLFSGPRSPTLTARVTTRCTTCSPARTQVSTPTRWCPASRYPLKGTHMSAPSRPTPTRQCGPISQQITSAASQRRRHLISTTGASRMGGSQGNHGSRPD
jgi:hypothetical protein